MRPRQELLQRVTDLETSFQQEKLDHQRETRFNRDIQMHEMELMQQISQIKNIMVSASSEFPVPSRVLECQSAC